MPAATAEPPTRHARTHNHLLDGLRGVAALAVMAYHFGGRTGFRFLEPRGYLAVDFFFVLSGFVLAYAYGERLRTSLTAGQFLLQRLIRLYPMLILGGLLGACIELWRPGASERLSLIARMTVLGCLALPWPFTTALGYTAFPINVPVWSVFFELFANLPFVLVARAAVPRLAAFVPIVLGGLVLVAIVIAFNSIDVGALVENWWGGFPRVLFGFFAGTLVFAYRHRFPALPAWVFAPFLLALFAVPIHQGALDGGLDLFAAVVIFPAFVGAAANSRVSARWLPLCILSGELSYPFYAIHLPLSRAVIFLFGKYDVQPAYQLAAFFPSMIFIVLASRLALRFYDQPLRRKLTGLLRHRAAAHGPRRALET